MADEVGQGLRACPGCGTAVAADRSVCASCGRFIGPAPTAASVPGSFAPKPADPPPPPPPGAAPPGAVPPGTYPPGPGSYAPPPTPGFSGGFTGGGAPPPGVWYAATYQPPAPRRRNGWVGPVVFLVLLGLAAAVVVIGVRSSSDDDATRSPGSGATPTTAPPAPSTTIPRATQSELLRSYCDAPGVKWPEVKPHIPGEPDRTQVRFLGGGLANASDTQGVEPRQMGSGDSFGGSTVISPHTDGAFIGGGAAPATTRTVACVKFVSTDVVGRTCYYNGRPNGFTIDTAPTTLEFSRNRYEITVYELHSGGILHKGEILTRDGGACPSWAYPDLGGGQLAYGLQDADILAWLNSHFVDGKPA